MASAMKLANSHKNVFLQVGERVRAQSLQFTLQLFPKDHL